MEQIAPFNAKEQEKHKNLQNQLNVAFALAFW